MAIRKFLVFIASLLACRLVPAQTPPAALAAGPAKSSQYLLGPDDQIKVWALGLEEISDKPVRIDPSGDIDLPTAGRVHAAGLTVEQLKAALVGRFSKELVHPQVSVEIVEFGSQPVSVMGAVNHPGVLQLHGHKTLAEVLSLAEGLKPDAGPRITISRQVQYGSIPLPDAKLDTTGQFSVAEVRIKELLAGTNPAENILISPHDVITVPVSEVVYVMGEVKKAGRVSLNDRDSISVLQALANAEGVGPNPAAAHNARIIRQVPGRPQPTEIPVDLDKIQAGKAEDIAMRPNDILLVPTNVPRKAAARALEAAVQMATGVAIWRIP